MQQLIADRLAVSLELLRNTLADFSDGDMLKRPASGANHAAWQLGHLAKAEAGMVEAVAPGKGARLPEGFKDRFSKHTVGSEDPATFGTKAELLGVMAEARAASIAWVRSLTPEQMGQPSPENLRGFAPTLGAMAVMFIEHTSMHIGQFQVIRRSLGKPVLF